MKKQQHLTLSSTNDPVSTATCAMCVATAAVEVAAAMNAHLTALTYARGADWIRARLRFSLHIADALCGALSDAFEDVRNQDKCYCSGAYDDGLCRYCESIADECNDDMNGHSYAMEEVHAWAEEFCEQYLLGMTLHVNRNGTWFTCERESGGVA